MLGSSAFPAHHGFFRGVPQAAAAFGEGCSPAIAAGFARKASDVAGSWRDAALFSTYSAAAGPYWPIACSVSTGFAKSLICPELMKAVRRNANEGGQRFTATLASRTSFTFC